MPVLTDEDIVRAIQAGTELRERDYKDDIILTGDKKSKAELVKDIIAIANSGGGLLIGGVRQTLTGFEPAGMSEEGLKHFDSTRLNEFVNNYCEPPINSITKIVTTNDRHFGIVLVPDFLEQPHIVTRNCADVIFAGDLFIRSANNNSVKIGPHDLRQLLNKSVGRRQGVFRDLLQSAIGNQKPLLIGQAKDALVSAPFDQEKYKNKYPGFRLTTLALENPSGPDSIRPMVLSKALAIAAISHGRSGSIIFPAAMPNRSTEKRLPIGVAYENESSSFGVHFSYLDVSGSVFSAESLWEDKGRTEAPPGTQIGWLTSFQRLYAALLFGRQYYPALGISGAWHVRFWVESSTPRALYMDTRRYWPFHEEYQNDMAIPVAVSRLLNTEMTIVDIDRLAKEMFMEFCWYFHFDLSEGDVVHFLENDVKSQIVIPSSLSAT